MKILSILFTVFSLYVINQAIAQVQTKVDLESIYKCNDMSFLNHNLVASHNPAPHGWENFTHAQSPLGRFTFPDVMAMHTGDVYTLQEKGVVQNHTLTKQEWLPWLFSGENDFISVKRTVGKDIFMAQVHSKKNQKGLAVMEFNKFTDHYYRYPRNIKMEMQKDKNMVIFKWEGYHVIVSFIGINNLMVCQDPQPMIRKFQGFDDVVIVDKSVEGCWERNGLVFIGAAFDKQLEISIEVTKNSEPTPNLTFESLSQKEREFWEDFFTNQVPAFKGNDPVIKDTYYFSWLSFWSNRCEGGHGMTPFPYISSGRYMYPMQFYWDEGFHSVLLSYLKDPNQSFQFLKNFSYTQAKDGGIPGSVSFSTNYKEYKKRTDSLGSEDMQPCVVAVAFDLLKQKQGWTKENMNTIYDVYTKNINWMYAGRDKDKDGLIEYTNSFQSGCDNSPRWDKQFENGVRIGPMRPVESVEQNVWIALLFNQLAEVARNKEDHFKAAEYKQRASELELMVEQLMWDEKDGFYYDIDAVTHKKIRVKSLMGFMALFLPHAKKDRVKRLVNEHLMNPKEFWTYYPVPSVSIDNPKFEPTDMWRGPTWVNINWLIVEGLYRQGYYDEAKQLARKTVDLVGSRYDGTTRTRTPRLWEWYNPVTGEPFGNENISWSSMTIDLIIRFL